MKTRSYVAISVGLAALTIMIGVVALRAFGQVEVIEETAPAPFNAPVDGTSSAVSPSFAANDPLRFLVTSPNAPVGRVAYPAKKLPVPTTPSSVPYYLITRSVPYSTQQNSLRGFYRATPNVTDLIFDPQFSPDGKTLLFKAGWPYERRSTYRIHLWNLQTKKLQAGPKEALVYPLVYWSPDGNFLAYISGGDVEGAESRGTLPLRLHIFNLKNSLSRVVVQNPNVTGIAWTRQNTLLYTSSSTNLAPSTAQAPKSQRPRLSLYEVPGSGGKPREIIKNVYGPTNTLLNLNVPRPSPSYDGNQIAFVGWPDESNDASGKAGEKTKEAGNQNVPVPSLNEDGEEVQRASLYIYNRARRNRILVKEMMPQVEDFLRWTQDGQRLIVMSLDYDQATTQARLESYEVQALASELSATPAKLAAMKAQDVENASHGRTSRQFQLLEVSRDGTCLFVKVEELRQGKGTSLTLIQSLHAVALKDGAVTLLARTESFKGRSLGLGWLDESVPAG